MFTVANPPLFTTQLPLKVLLKELEYHKIAGIIFLFSNIYEDEVLVRQLHSSVLSFKSLEIPIFFIAPVPVYKFHVPKTLHLKLVHNEVEINSGLTRFEYEQTINAFLRLMKKWKIPAEQVHIPGNYLCSNNSCEIFEKDFKPLYFDSNHLTKTGASKLRPIFKEILVVVKGSQS